MVAYISPYVTDVQMSDHDHTAVAGSTNPVFYTAPVQPSDHNQPIVTDSTNPVFYNDRKPPMPQMPQMPPEEAARLMNPKSKTKRKDTAKKISSAKTQSKSASTEAFDKAYPNAELPAEQQRAKDWADTATPPPKQPAKRRAGLEELDANDVNAGPKTQKPKRKQHKPYHRPDLDMEYVGKWTAEEISKEFWTDASRRINRGMETKAKPTPDPGPNTSTNSASTAPPAASHSTWSYTLKTPAPLPSDILANAPKSPPSPSPRPKPGADSSASRSKTSISPIKRSSPLAPKCMHSYRFTINGECMACMQDAAMSEPTRQNNKSKPPAVNCARGPHCTGEGKCYFCAYLALGARRDADGDLKPLERPRDQVEGK